MLITQIPEKVDDSWYKGVPCITLELTATFPSTSIRNAAEIANSLVSHYGGKIYLTLETTYFFSAKKCGKSGWITCDPISLPVNVFERLHHPPDRVPQDDGNLYKSFIDICRKPIAMGYIAYYKGRPVFSLCATNGLWKC